MKRFTESNILIATFSVTTILLTLAVCKSSGRLLPAAVASGMGDRAGEYVVSVGSSADRDEEIVFVFDLAAQAMNSYRFDFAKRKIELIQQFSLEDLRRNPKDAGGTGKRP